MGCSSDIFYDKENAGEASLRFELEKYDTGTGNWEGQRFRFPVTDPCHGSRSRVARLFLPTEYFILRLLVVYIPCRNQVKPTTYSTIAFLTSGSSSRFG